MLIQSFIINSYMYILLEFIVLFSYLKCMKKPHPIVIHESKANESFTNESFTKKFQQ